MRHATRLAVLTAALIVVPATQAQPGLFTERGFGGELNYQSGDGFSQPGVSLAYAVNRLFEAGVAVARESQDDSDWTSTYITPRFRVYAARQSDAMPVTIWGEAHYHFISISGFDDSDDYSASGYGVGVGATRAFPVGETFVIRPFGTVAYSGYTEEYSVGGFTDDYTTNPFLITLGVYGSTPIGPGTLYVSPFYFISTETDDWYGYQQVGIAVGLTVDQ